MSLDEVALIMDYGGVKGGRDGAMTAMHELRAAKEQSNAENQKQIEEGKDTPAMVENVANLDAETKRREN